jgi:hypothetical protein
MCSSTRNENQYEVNYSVMALTSVSAPLVEIGPKPQRHPFRQSRGRRQIEWLCLHRAALSFGYRHTAAKRPRPYCSGYAPFSVADEKGRLRPRPGTPRPRDLCRVEGRQAFPQHFGSRPHQYGVLGQHRSLSVSPGLSPECAIHSQATLILNRTQTLIVLNSE